MRIILFRHGPAGSRNPAKWPDDRLRPLTPGGTERTRRAARGLGRVIGKPAAILTSPLKRAEGTARLLSESLEGAPIESADALVPGSPAGKILEALSRFKANDTVVLVGHEPHLGKLAGALAIGPSATIPLRKAGACAIDFETRVQTGGGQIRWLLSPKILRRLGGKKFKKTAV